MKERQPPSDSEIKEYVEQILDGADLEQITMKTVYTQVYSHYPDFDLTHKKGFITATTKSIIGLEPSTVQLEKLLQFLEQNPEIATGAGRANNAHEGLQTSQKWEAVAQELNLLQGANRTPESWAEYWSGRKVGLEYTIARRKLGATGSQAVSQQPRLSDMSERMILLLERHRNEEVSVEPTSTTHTQEAPQQAAVVDDDMEAESTGNASQTEQPPASEPSTSTAPSAPRRGRRTRVVKRPRTTIQRLIRLEEQRIQVTLANAEALNGVAATIDRLAAFITDCGLGIARELERRNTPN